MITFYLSLIFAVKVVVIGSEIEMLSNLRDVNRFDRVGNVYVGWDRRHNI
jgi:hypothetical protein